MWWYWPCTAYVPLLARHQSFCTKPRPVATEFHHQRRQCLHNSRLTIVFTIGRFGANWNARPIAMTTTDMLTAALRGLWTVKMIDYLSCLNKDWAANVALVTRRLYRPLMGKKIGLNGTHGSGSIFFGACNLKFVYLSNLGNLPPTSSPSCERCPIGEIPADVAKINWHSIYLVAPTHNVLPVLRAVFVTASMVSGYLSCMEYRRVWFGGCWKVSCIFIYPMPSKLLVPWRGNYLVTRQLASPSGIQL